MLLTALRQGTTAVRRAGWPAYAVALLAALPDLVPTTEDSAPITVALAPIVGLVRTVLFLGLIRVLAAHRDEPVPPPPAVDASGVRVVSSSVVEPAGEDDRRVRFALRRAAMLGRPALRLFALSLLGAFGAFALWALLCAAAGLEIKDVGSRDPVAVVPLTLLTALLFSFIALADQRVALEGDARVLLAAAHSVRIAGVAFAAVFGLVLLASSPSAVGSLLPHDVGALPWQLLRIVGGAWVQLVALAALNEVYLAGPRADLVVDAARSA
ncbi:MAG TPA: hypothetical protein VNA14_10235 [Mycobacteriales bacterium]|nr:hypothetical protein [Mycobacteriales bacterium]